MIKNKLYIAEYESASYDGFLAENIGYILYQSGTTLIECVPNFHNINIPNNLSDIDDQNRDYECNIDTIIQYVSLDIAEYHNQYKNIFIYRPIHFPTRIKSIIDKLNIFDEIWVFDKNSQIFLNDTIDNTFKIKNKGYPYIPNKISNIFQNIIPQKNKDIFTYYTIIREFQLEYIEDLIINFINVFYKTDDVSLVIYVEDDGDSLLEMNTRSIIEYIKEKLIIIPKHVIDKLITIIRGNPYIDKVNYAKLHANSDCYINIDYLTNYHTITASYLQKYCISITNIDNILEFNPDHIIQTYRSSARTKFLNKQKYKSFINEFNLCPRVLDESIKNKLIMIYQQYKDHKDPVLSYKSLNKDGFFNDNN